MLDNFKRASQPKIAKLGAGVWERNSAEGRVGPTDGYDVNILAVGE